MPAASSVITAAGAQLAISATLPTAHTIDGFTALTFTDVAEVVDLGEAGKVYNIVEHSPLGEREVLRLKGSFTQGDRSIALGRDITDAGQALLLAANDLDTAQAFRITLQNGDLIYFTALVNGYTDAIGTIDSIIGSNLTLLLCQDIFRILSTGITAISFTTGGAYTGGAAGSFLVTQASTDQAGSGATIMVTMTVTAATAGYIVNSGSGYIATEVITIDPPTGHAETTAATFTVSSIA